MTQKQALQQVQTMYPDKAIRLSRMHSIGTSFGHDDEFYIWDHTNGDCIIMAKSEHSWEHAIAKIEADHIEATTPPDHSSVEDDALGVF